MKNRKLVVEMKRVLKILNIISLGVLLLFVGCVQNKNTSIELLPDFNLKVTNHITELCKNNGRYIGSVFEKEAAGYIKQQFSEIGLHAEIENFEFESYEIDQSVLTIGDLILKPARLCFNPYKDSSLIQNSFVLVDQISDTDLTDKFVIATEQIDYFQLVFKNPKMIIYVDSLDFKRIENQSINTFNLEIKGAIKNYNSANVVANFKTAKKDDKEIIVCAHYDSYLGSPGADDNASGVATAIELARTLFKSSSKLKDFNIKFIAFSGEEKGLLGSRHYLDTHADELKNCVLLINLDQIGGHGKINIEVLDSIKGIPEIKGENQFPKYLQDKPFEGISSRWTIIEPGIFGLMAISNTPNWLVEIINQSSVDMDINQTMGSGSDQMVFTQAGIVSTCIFTGGNEYHSSKDIPAQVNISTLERVGKLTLNIVKNTIDFKN